MAGEIQKIKPIYFRYYEGTSQESRDAVKSSVTDFLKKVGSKAFFLSGTTISVSEEYDDISISSPLSEYLKNNGNKHFYTHGCTIFPEINNNKKEIFIKTEEYKFPERIWRSELKQNILKQGVLHEIGHLFDDYFGTKSKILQKQVKEIKISDKQTPIENAFITNYKKHKDLSDNQDFKDAWKKDVENLGKDKTKYEKFKNSWLLSYYTPTEIDITDGVSDKEIEDADNYRSEVFAQLFGYAFGKDDGYKKELLETFPNTYKIVKNYIKKYLGVDCDIPHANLTFLY